SKLGNQKGFDDAMARVQAAHNHSLEQGVKASYFLSDHARYLALANDHQSSIETLLAAMDEGWLMSVRPEEIWPEMAVLAGEPEYEAALSRMAELANTERAELGLEPLSI